MKKNVKKFLISKKYDEILVGFSGGADSTALLLILNELRQELGYELTAVHFEHGIRGESSICDKIWAEKFCLFRDIKFVSISLNILKEINKKKRYCNLEAYAREARLKQWQKLTEGKNRRIAVALAHHLDDKIEELFMRLTRGCNCSGLVPLRKENRVNGILFIRPLLDFSKDEIIAYLTKLGINEWCEDFTNRDTRLFRNFLRHTILPKIYEKHPIARKGIPVCLDVLQVDADYLEAAAEDEYRKHVVGDKLLIKWLCELHPAIKIRVLKLWMNENSRGKKYFVPSHKFVERLNICLSKSHFCGYINISGDWFVYSDGSFISLKKRENKEFNSREKIIWDITESFEMKWGKYIFNADIFSVDSESVKRCLTRCKGQDIVYFDYTSIEDILLIKAAEPGDKMIPFGGKEPVKVKRFFRERKISPDERQSYPVICTRDTRIIWIPYIRRSNESIITENTKKIVELSVKVF